MSREYSSPRRDESAAQTRRAVLTAAAELFAQHGYTGTTVAQIADKAQVAPATVYASVGGKGQLLVALLAAATADAGIDHDLAALPDPSRPRDLIDALAHATLASLRRQATVASVLWFQQSPDPKLAHVLRAAEEKYRARLGVAAERLDGAGMLAEGVSVSDATDIFWFCFNPSAWRTLGALHWSDVRAERWLSDQAAHAVLGPSAGR